MSAFPNSLYNNIMMSIANIDDVITVYYLWGVIFCYYSKYSQHSLLSLPGFNDTTIYTYQRARLSTFMLVNYLYITFPLNLVMVREIFNIQY